MDLKIKGFKESSAYNENNFQLLNILRQDFKNSLAATIIF